MTGRKSSPEDICLSLAIGFYFRPYKGSAPWFSWRTRQASKQAIAYAFETKQSLTQRTCSPFTVTRCGRKTAVNQIVN